MSQYLPAREMPSLHPGVRRVSRLLLPALALVLAGCAASPPPQTEADAGQLVTVDNCGFEVSFDAPPQRVVTIKSTPAELLLALGLGDRIVGAAFLDGPLPEGSPDLEVISEKVPGQEVVLSLEPDLVFAGWESNLTAEGAGERDRLADLGVHTLVPPSACKGAEYQPRPMTFDLLFEEFEQVGEIFGVRERAAALVAEQRAELAAAEPRSPGLSAVWYSSGRDVPFVGGRIGAPQMVMDAVGLTNVIDVEDTWASVGWESIVAADPDVIVLVDAAWNTAESKIEQLRADPVTSRMAAVENSRFLVVPFPAGEAGVRSVGAVTSLLAQLSELGL